MMNERELMEIIVGDVITKIHNSPDVDRNQIQTLIQIGFSAQKVLHPTLEEKNFDFQRAAERVLTIHGAGTSVNSHISFRSAQHEEWLGIKRDKVINGVHWNSFKQYYLKRLSKEQIDELDNSSDRILGLMEDPERVGNWHSRGLVIGDVQSGKTTSFIAVSNKAIDVGYKVIVVLSGTLNNLRKQTQIRFEEGVSGWNTGSKAPCGVANPPPFGVEAYDIKLPHLTSRDDRGDFLANRDPSSKLGGVCVFSVNKKNSKTLENLIAYFEAELSAVQNAQDLPLLLIDDEADNASINTVRTGSSPINGLVKSLLSLFPRNSYLAYTATPFANVLINPSDEEDLFPRNYIVTLGRPDNYIGPSRVFGSINDDGEEDDIEVVDRDVDLDWFRNLDAKPYHSDWETFIPNPNRQDSIDHMDELPFSLRDSIYSFFISIAVRHLRGDVFEHKTMLIHATRLTALQNRLHELVDHFVDEIHAALTIKQLGGEDRHTKRIREIFTTDFQNVGQEWHAVQSKLSLVANLLKGNVYAINGDNKDVIDEETYPRGLHSIRIGGDKLSRGLTLPGLMTSYFLRVSRMYDTLMQMGRWFGYRENYEDLCRIYTTARLFNWFGHVSNASEALRSRIIEMNNLKLTPREYGQRVQSHPGTMLVTALNKQYFSEEISLSFSGELVQLTGVDLSKRGQASQLKNASLLEKFMAELTKNTDFDDELGARVFKSLGSRKIIKFIEEFVHTEHAGLWNSARLRSYISAMNEEGELQDWSVAFQTNTMPKAPSVPIDVGGFTMHSNVRNGILTGDNVFTLNNRGLVSIGHEKFDIEKNKRADLKSRKATRKARSSRNGLLIIYWVTPSLEEGETAPSFPSLAISFPYATNARTVNYIAGAGYEDLDEELENELYEDDIELS